MALRGRKKKAREFPKKLPHGFRDDRVQDGPWETVESRSSGDGVSPHFWPDDPFANFQQRHLNFRQNAIQTVARRAPDRRLVVLRPFVIVLQI